MTKRRDVVKVLAMTPLAALVWTREEMIVAAERVERFPQQTPVFFNAQEWKTIRVLVDDIIPRDEIAGSATEAKVPEFMDFMLNDGNPQNRTNMRDGLLWLDQESRKRYGKPYAECGDMDRTRILDDISFPAKATEAFRTNVAPFARPAGNAQGTTPVTWFNAVRNLTAGGYFSSRVGYKSIGFTGGVGVSRWIGSSPAIMQKLGLSYDEWDKKYGKGF